MNNRRLESVRSLCISSGRFSVCDEGDRVREQDINPTHSFCVADAVKYGSIEKALLVKEIRGLQVYKLRRGLDGWVYYSANALAEKFPYMVRRSIDRWLRELVDDGHLEAEVRNKVKYDQTRSYRVPNMSECISQNDQSTLAKMATENGQNEQPIPSHTSHTSQPAVSEPALASPLKTARSGSRPNHKGEHSPAKERLRKALETGGVRALKEAAHGV